MSEKNDVLGRLLFIEVTDYKSATTDMPTDSLGQDHICPAGFHE